MNIDKEGMDKLKERMRKFTTSNNVVFITAKQPDRPYTPTPVQDVYKGPIIADYLNLLGSN